jgi:hypothetical protein
VGNPRDEPNDPIADGVSRRLPYGPRLEGTEEDGRDRGVPGLLLLPGVLIGLAEPASPPAAERHRRGGRDVQHCLPDVPGAIASHRLLPTPARESRHDRY